MEEGPDPHSPVRELVRPLPVLPPGSGTACYTYCCRKAPCRHTNVCTVVGRIEGTPALGYGLPEDRVYLSLFTTVPPTMTSAQRLAVRGISHPLSRRGGREGLAEERPASPPQLHPPNGQAGGGHCSHLRACVLSKVLPTDVGHDPRRQRIAQHVNHGAETVPGEPRWAVSGGHCFW